MNIVNFIIQEESVFSIRTGIFLKNSIQIKFYDIKNV